MTVTMPGVIKGRRIELDAEPGLPDGLRVQVRIEAPKARLEEKRRKAARLFGSCAADPTFAAAVAQVERQRRLKRPRKVDFDVAP